jgi:hypothetical protein
MAVDARILKWWQDKLAGIEAELDAIERGELVADQKHVAHQRRMKERLSRMLSDQARDAQGS